ncbi:MAG: phenylalanine--tRNA ligase beta subunit-related protein [Patescibacteria group bacterium]
MKISYEWLKLYFKKLPKPEKVAELLTMHSFEVENIDEVRLRRTKSDFVLNIDVLPNRAHDCLSHYGIAKELAALLDYKIQYPKIKILNKSKIKNLKLKIDVQETELCRRYIGRIIEGVKIGPSPKWIKERLEAIGQKSINNIVDATNFVMFETGQPLHAFDADKVEEKIIVRRAKKGEKIETLDNQKIELDGDILIIADEKSPLAIAGIKGGKKAEIDKNTKNLILEAANFEPARIKETSKKINLATESSLRFESGIAPETAELAMERVTSIIQGLFNPTVCPIVDFYPRRAQLYKIGICPKEITKVLGIHLEEKEITDIFRRLGLKVKKLNPLRNVLSLSKKLLDKKYQYGASITYDAPGYFDCSSFISYVFAHSGIQIPRITVDQYFFGKHVDKKEIRPGDVIFSNTKKGKIHYQSKNFMKGQKIKEGIDHCGIYLGKGKVIHATKLKGKVTIEDLKKSQNFKNIIGIRRLIRDDDYLLLITIPPERIDLRLKEDLIEELARVYGYQKFPSRLPEEIIIPPKRNDNYFYSQTIKDILTSVGFSEIYNYSFAKEGSVEIENPITPDKKYLRTNLSEGLKETLNDNLRYFKKARIFEIGKIFPVFGETISLAAVASDLDFYGMKGIVNIIFEKLGIVDFYYEDAKDKIADVRIGNTSVGSIDHNFFEINFEMLIKLVEEKTEYKPILRYPAIKRDLSIFIPPNTRVVDVLDVIENVGGMLLVNTELFDIYELPDEDKKSFAFHLIFQSDKKTLSDTEINGLMQKIMRALDANPEWEVRK